MPFDLQNIKDIKDDSKIATFYNSRNNYLLYKVERFFIVQPFSNCGEYYVGQAFTDMEEARECFKGKINMVLNLIS